MDQLGFSDVEFRAKRNQSRREKFLEEDVDDLISGEVHWGTFSAC
jgi:hypothetical protein